MITPPFPARARLQGQTAIVTGAGSLREGLGTGKAIALVFAAEGARLALLDLDRDRAQETLGLIQAAGGDAIVVAARRAGSRLSIPKWGVIPRLQKATADAWILQSAV